MTLNIQHWPTDQLIPYARNARTHTDEQVAQIAGSIAEFGFVNPVLVGEDKVIIAGHGRLLAAQRLGLSEVPVIVLDHLNETQRRALVLADNQISANAGWNDELLSLELSDLASDEFDLSLLGFTEDALNELLNNSNDPGLVDEDAVPEVEPNPVSQLGDVWQLGNHRVMCGDATSAEAMSALMDGQMADMVFTDPPYNVDYGNAAKDTRQTKDRRILNDNLGDAFYDFLHGAMIQMLSVTKGALYVSMSSSELDTLQKAFRDAGGKWSTFIIWAKNTFTLGRADYQRQFEPILYGWKEGNDHFWCGARDQGDVWFINKPNKNDLHPTMKPVELVERAIRNSSKSQDIVLDAFGGSGTTIIACEKTGRYGRVLELDPKYVDVIIKRWQDYSGSVATRAVDSVKFNDLVDSQQSGNAVNNAH